MTQKTRANLGTSIDTNLASGSSITASELRSELHDGLDSHFNILTDTLDQITEGSTNKHFTATERTKLTALQTGVVSRAVTAATALLADDSGKAVEVDSASAVDVTVPLNATEAIPVGTIITIVQIGAGQVTFVPESGSVTVRTPETLKIAKQYGAASIYKRDTNEWVLMGNLELA